MANNGVNGRSVFPLTGLQIGDLQSYLSHLSLFLAPESKKFYILVDNRPWLKDLVSRPAHLWQLMVTKSRMSPFANTRGRKERRDRGAPLQASQERSTSQPKKIKRWFFLIDAASLSRKRALLPVKKLRNSLVSNSKLHRTLYGFIVFEVAWNDVRGINYLNELQTDTSLAIEAKIMNRWEFDSVAQAARCIALWFPGTFNEKLTLKDYLESTIGEVFYDAQECFPKTDNSDDNSSINDDMSNEDGSPGFVSGSFRLYPATLENETSILQTPPPPDGPYKRRKVMKSICTTVDAESCPEESDFETFGSPVHSLNSYTSDCEDVFGATQYKDVLISFRFNDPDLPFRLKDIIVSDLRLLTLLEAGLPSWVIFLQSYPVFCHLYRPWMCPLARALYVLISFVTVLIGFYDLYKNVPVLKATASRLFGPLFDWIETWEMISRIKYLGTMLFLHNSQKALKWFLMMTRNTRSFLSVIAQPMTGPIREMLEIFLPVWNMCIDLVDGCFSAVWIALESSCNLVGDFIEILLLPLWYLLSVMWNVATSFIYPMFWIIWEILYAPVRLVLGICSLVAFLCACINDLVGEIWLFVSSIFRFTSNVEATVSSYEVSMWRSLWNDLFSHVFRALRSILNGFVAFFAACNRHRLSIYNHARGFLRKLSRSSKGLRCAQSSQGETSGTQKMFNGKEDVLHEMKSRKIR